MGFRPVFSAITVAREYLNVSAPANIASGASGTFDLVKIAGDDLIDLSGGSAPFTFLESGLICITHDLIGPLGGVAGAALDINIALSDPTFTDQGYASQMFASNLMPGFNDAFAPGLVLPVEAGWLGQIAYSRDADGGAPWTVGGVLFVSQLIF